jgi:hypothetical protein
VKRHALAPRHEEGELEYDYRDTEEPEGTMILLQFSDYEEGELECDSLLLHCICVHYGFEVAASAAARNFLNISLSFSAACKKAGRHGERERGRGGERGERESERESEREREREAHREIADKLTERREREREAHREIADKLTERRPLFQQVSHV